MYNYILSAAFIILLSNCTIAGSFSRPEEEDSADIAIQYLGLDENYNKREIQDLIGFDPTQTEWCAAFVNSILDLDNIPNLHDYDAKYPLLAREFLKYGDMILESEIQKGDLVIFPRGDLGWQGHVGFYVDTYTHNKKQYYLILGGNQSGKVSIQKYPTYKALGIRRYTAK